MDYYGTFGMVAVCVIVLIGFIWSIKSNSKKEQEVLTKLELSIGKLDSTISNLIADNEKRDRRIDRHGEQIDNIDHRLIVMESKQDFKKSA